MHLMLGRNLLHHLVPTQRFQRHTGLELRRDDRLRHRIENALCRPKDFRRIATRYDRLARNFLTPVCIIAAILW